METERPESSGPELDADGFPVYDRAEEGEMPEDREFAAGKPVYAGNAGAAEETDGEPETAAPGTENAETDTDVTENTGSDAAGTGNEETENGAAGEGAAEAEETEIIGYENGFFGLAYRLPYGWTIETGQEMEDLAGYLKAGGTYRDLFARSDHGISNVSVVIERLRVMHTEMMPAEELLEKTAAHMEEDLAAAGAQEITVTGGISEFLGQDLPCIQIEAVLSEVKVFETQYLLIRGTYVANIIAVSYGEDHTGMILEQFGTLTH
ncbi:MAG: hypothetical protein J6P87_00630 [Lachnospiraceae bacterium]|nr:hypothetical protein [Lachnospiraceae bacterium]